VGINTFKTLNSGRVLIETNSKEEVEALEKENQAKCGGDLEINIHTLRKPRLILLNILEDISTINIEDSILMQNPNLNLRNGEIVAKFSYVTKNMNRNLAVEVGADTRKILLHRKIISTINIEDSILMQNPNLNLRNGEIVAKFSYVTKKMNRNLAVEVGADTR